MPSAPKPSDRKLRAKKEKAVKTPRAKKEKAPRKERVRKEGSKAHNIPKRGKCAEWIEEIKNSGWITKQELVDGCTAHGLAPTMHNVMASYCKHLDLLKEEKQSAA